MEWEVASGTCLRVIKVNLIEPSASVMSLHWSKVIKLLNRCRTHRVAN